MEAKIAKKPAMPDETLHGGIFLLFLPVYLYLKAQEFEQKIRSFCICVKCLNQKIEHHRHHDPSRTQTPHRYAEART